MTTTIRVAKDIHAPAADVWDIVSNFTALPNWFPGVTAFECNGKQEGCTRKVTLGSRDTFTEKLI
ncbi:MAG TPA: SRPBCC family protein, partial [Pseudomonadales bacterium]|nr:SRPBCC family protein [Pseudomonadales bacterium]